MSAFSDDHPSVPRQKILVFDSGLGGLTVYRAIRALRPDADYLYLGDDALFPYGRLAPEVLIARVNTVIGEAMAEFPADCIVIACNTASTLVLPELRARFSVPIVGTVPAIKPAAALTKTGMISVLATPGTVSRDYTQDLIREFADGVQVTLVGSKALAGLAERALRGEAINDADIAAEIAPCFVETKAPDQEAQTGKTGRTDVVVLACTHYPLLLERLTALAPWPVEWIDPAPAIARRVVQVLAEGRVEGEGDPRIQMTGSDSKRVELTLTLQGSAMGFSQADIERAFGLYPLRGLAEILHSMEVGGQSFAYDVQLAFRKHIQVVAIDKVLEALEHIALMPDVPDEKVANIHWSLVSRVQVESDPLVFQKASEWTSSTNPALRSLGVEVLGQLGWPNRNQDAALPFKEQTAQIIDRLLSDPEDVVVDSTLIAASHQRTGDVHLIARHAASSLQKRRWNVAFALSSRDEPLARKTLIALSRDEDASVRDWATFSLGSQSDADTPEIRAALIARLDDGDADTRAEATIGLARRGDRRVLAEIAKELARPDVGRIYFEAAEFLPDLSFLPLLESFLTNDAYQGYEREMVEAAIDACKNGIPKPLD